MKKGKKIILAVIVLIAAIQLIRPAKNFTTKDPPADIADKYEVPMNVLMTFNDACYDCHSDYTKYPWYYNVQPVGWWMAWHVREGKQHLNFSEFGNYPPDQAKKKFHHIYEEMRDRSMPLKSYLLEHPAARLSAEKYRAVEEWALKMSEQPRLVGDTTAAK